MADQRGPVVRVLPRIADIDAAAWDALANPPELPYHPFVAHAFLRALEDAETVNRRTGWVPHHIVLEEDGRAVGAMPCYVKSHSQGEYVFDHGWAEAYANAGGRYYPKLQIAVPFTPVPGPRLCVKPGPRAAADRAVLGEAAAEIVRQHGLSSVHVTFLDRSAQTLLTTQGYLARTGQQFHWLNQGFATFEDFLETFASRKRKAVRKERAEAVSSGLTIEVLTGREITEAHWDAMFQFYTDTGNRKWGRPYLNRRFFSLLGGAMADRCLLVLASKGGRPIAGALNMIGGDCLYGRYWGALEHHPSLHFELCYYQAIDYAITKGLTRVEAGAQGEHKLARGYLPVETYSAHWIADPALRKAVARFLDSERAAIRAYNAELAAAGPYRKDTGGG